MRKGLDKARTSSFLASPLQTRGKYIAKQKSVSSIHPSKHGHISPLARLLVEFLCIMFRYRWYGICCNAGNGVAVTNHEWVIIIPAVAAVQRRMRSRRRRRRRSYWWRRGIRWWWVCSSIFKTAQDILQQVLVIEYLHRAAVTIYNKERSSPPLQKGKRRKKQGRKMDIIIESIPSSSIQHPKHGHIILQTRQFRCIK